MTSQSVLVIYFSLLLVNSFIFSIAYFRLCDEVKMNGTDTKIKFSHSFNGLLEDKKKLIIFTCISLTTGLGLVLIKGCSTSVLCNSGVCVILLCSSLIDIKIMCVPDTATILLTIMYVLKNVIGGSGLKAVLTCVIAIVFLSILYMVWRNTKVSKYMGYGDIKICTILFLYFSYVLFEFLISLSISCLLWGIFYMIVEKKSKGVEVAFIPVIGTATLLTVLII